MILMNSINIQLLLTILRKARNQILHSQFHLELRNTVNYQKVTNNDGTLLDWSKNQIDEYCRDVLSASRKIL